MYNDTSCTVSIGIGGSDFNVGGDPVEVFGLTSGGTVTLGLRISLFAGPVPALVKYVVFSTSAFSINEHDTASGTIYGHANAAGAEAVGAAFYQETPEFGTAPPLLESFSSAGPTPIYFDTLGLEAFEVRDKPEIVAPDGTNTTFFGFDVEPDGFPNFFGTSAAAPHAAGVAALMLEAAGPLTPAQVYAALENTAIDMDAPGFDFDTGFGLIDAVLAVTDLAPPPVMPVLTSISVTPASGASVAAGQTQQFTATGTFDDGSSENLTSTATWVSSALPAATIDATGLATGVSVGNTLITATQDGITSNAAPLEVTGAPADVVTITEAKYRADRKELKVKATSSGQPAAVLTVVGFGQMTFKKDKYELKIKPLAPELVPQTVTVVSSLGGTAMAAVQGAPAPPATLVSIAVTPSAPSVGVGLTLQFTATGTFDDASTVDLTASASWLSDDESVATINAGGLATGVSVGTAEITATQNGVTSAVTLGVTPPAAETGDDVTITKAEWKQKNSELKVTATSTEQPGAVLTVVGYGQMTFKKGKYELKIKPVANPGTVTVTSSLGGSATKSVKVR